MENTNQINKESWDAYQEDYMKFHLMWKPEYFEFFSNGGIILYDYLAPMLGDIKGLKLLDTCCACDAKQAFSWHNLGAVVTACDIAPKAIEIAKANAVKMNFDIEFVEADMQTLEPIGDNQYDIVFAHFPCWVQDLSEACRNWRRVLKSGGKLLLNTTHPIMDCIDTDENGLIVSQNYNNPAPDRGENFGGTPMADRFGGWSVDLPSVCNSYRTSDILNAICDAGFMIKKVLETNSNADLDKLTDETLSEIYLMRLPNEFTVLAIK